MLKFDKLKKLRQNITETNIKNWIIVCEENEIAQAVEAFKKISDNKIEKICLTPCTYRSNETKKYENIQVENLEKNLKKRNLALYVTYEPQNSWYNTLNYMVQCNNTNRYYFTDKKYNTNYLLTQYPSEYIYFEESQNIEKAYNLLSSRKSKKIFLENLKSYLEGDSGYLEYSDSVIYFPKHLSPTVKEGDIVIDAGISDIITDVESYSKLVGDKGKVFAFEASPVEYSKSKQVISCNVNLINVDLIKQGLWSCNTVAQIANCGCSSSLVYEIPGEYIDCKLTTLDSFVYKNTLEKVDYIKMDIEGAELEALKGAEKTIKRFKPDMAICISHLPKHLWEIILLINSFEVPYNYYIEHYSATFCDTVLYCVKKNTSYWGNLFKFRL